MGLDFDGADARWSYSGFMRFRERLFEMVAPFRDTDLTDMEGFGGSLSWDAVHDAIVPLLNHSDCEGDLPPDECRTVAPRLRELVSQWKGDDYDRQMAEKLADGMEECANKGEPLIFC